MYMSKNVFFFPAAFFFFAVEGSVRRDHEAGGGYRVQR